MLADDLKVMDASAVALCRDNNIPIVVFNIREPGKLAAVLAGRRRRHDRVNNEEHEPMAEFEPCRREKADLERRMHGARRSA